MLLGALALGAPAAALADGSAGDQQYNDPFAGGGGNATTTTHSDPTATTPPMPSTTPTTRETTPATSPAPATTTTTAPAPAPASADTTVANAAVHPSTSAGPTATIAGGSSAGGSSSTLPYTGYDAWAGAGFGAAMLAAGIGLRLRTRRA